MSRSQGPYRAHLGELEGVADQARDANAFLFDKLTIALTDVFFAAMALFLSRWNVASASCLIRL